MKKCLLNVTLVTGSIIFTCLALEVALHFFPVSTGISIQPVNSHNHTFHAVPNKKVRYSRLWNFENVRVKKINNAGFVNPQDYHAEHDKPLLAVVGDSYIEAMQVQDNEAYPSLLQAKAKDMRVYSFGFSGAPLSQYLIWAQYARQNYKNDYLIINVVGNDFDESLQKYYSFVPGYYLYTPDASGELYLQRNDWKPSKARELAKKSYLLSYLVRNVEIVTLKDRIKSKLAKRKPEHYVANTSAKADHVRVSDSYEAIDAFFRDLPKYSGLDPKHIMLVLDDRTQIYQDAHNEDIQETYFHLMKKYFLAKATELGYSTIDLAVPFKEHFQTHQQRFEFSFDHHWNSLGHSVVADSIMHSKWWQDMLSQEHLFGA